MAKLNSMSLAGIVFKPISFIPNSSKFKNELCHGTFIDVVDRKFFNTLKAALELLYAIDELYPGKLELNHMLDLLMGDGFITRKNYTLEEIFQKLVLLHH